MQDSGDPVDLTESLKGFNPKEIKQNASEIVKAGAALYDALGQEPELRDYRARAVAGHVDTEFVERSIREAIAQVWCACSCALGELPCMHAATYMHVA